VIIDGWVGNSAIRRDALRGLALMLAGVVLLATVVAAVIDAAARSLVETGAGAISAIGGGVGVGRYVGARFRGGAGSRRPRRQQR
jgi:hypothetical protein